MGHGSVDAVTVFDEKVFAAWAFKDGDADGLPRTLPFHQQKNDKKFI